MSTNSNELQSSNTVSIDTLEVVIPFEADGQQMELKGKLKNFIFSYSTAQGSSGTTSTPANSLEVVVPLGVGGQQAQLTGTLEDFTLETVGSAATQSAAKSANNIVGVTDIHVSIK